MALPTVRLFYADGTGRSGPGVPAVRGRSPGQLCGGSAGGRGLADALSLYPPGTAAQRLCPAADSPGGGTAGRLSAGAYHPDPPLLRRNADLFAIAGLCGERCKLCVQRGGGRAFLGAHGGAEPCACEGVSAARRSDLHAAVRGGGGTAQAADGLAPQPLCKPAESGGIAA